MRYDYKKICANLLNGLPQRTKEVLERRFGLRNGQRETLEAIGESHGVTRERVRQIENEGLSIVKTRIKEYPKLFQYFNEILKTFGGLKKEDILLNTLSRNELQSEVFFLLNLGGNFERFSEDKNFYSFWANKKGIGSLVPKVVNIAQDGFKKEKTLLALDNLFASAKTALFKVLGKEANKNIFNSYLEISKQIQKNPYNVWGLKDWVEINPRGIKDRAFLVFKREEKPLHFTQIANLIEQLPFPSKRKVQVAAVHNELIRDPRFVLVGRGLYALKEWGYQPGVVKDIISTILKNADKPLQKEEIIEGVLKQRFVKKNTIILNLQDKNYFLRDSRGNYKINPVQEA